MSTIVLTIRVGQKPTKEERQGLLLPDSQP